MIDRLCNLMEISRGPCDFGTLPLSSSLSTTLMVRVTLESLPY